MDTIRVKVFKDIPDQDTLSNMMADYKVTGAQVGWSQQHDGLYHMEVVQAEPVDQSGSLRELSQFTSPVTGQALNRG